MNEVKAKTVEESKLVHVQQLIKNDILVTDEQLSQSIEQLSVNFVEQMVPWLERRYKYELRRSELFRLIEESNDGDMLTFADYLKMRIKKSEDKLLCGNLFPYSYDSISNVKCHWDVEMMQETLQYHKLLLCDLLG